VIQIREADEARAMQILFRKFSGTMLPNQTWLLSDEAVRALASAGVPFTELSRPGQDLSLEGALAGERV
jgi:hypothetical protein